MPEILDAVPTDPFADDSAALRYRRTDEGYQVYSIWADGVDDGGKPPEPTEGIIYWGADNRGDLSLDALYWEPPPPPAPVYDEDLMKQLEENTNRISDDADDE
ncbi:hypothetical protein [Posidoniimonas polymericola]|uniref:hypothetical protein n=1 Tax=Posidoniimonas polymericola TaxID=2528002 RepID=UPI0011B79B8A|nr:hypothetical protein [Posidoniimonas polymericola]